MWMKGVYNVLTRQLYTVKGAGIEGVLTSVDKRPSYAWVYAQVLWEREYDKTLVISVLNDF